MKVRGPMMCSKPYVGATGLPYGCGQCMECRYNKRRVWMHRIMLEAAQYEHNAFVTLTYDDEHLPEGRTLVPKHYQDWLKRLRLAVAPSRFRFFLVGEYGDETQRPHYHAMLFGFPTCESGDTRFQCISRPCHWCGMVRDTWGKGNILLGRVEDDSAGYVSGYVVKKMTDKRDPRLEGRYPEFGRMSLKPGIGFSALWDIADKLLLYELGELMDDVPSDLRYGAKKRLPMGRYLTQNLRKMVGKDAKAPQVVLDKIAEELLPLRIAARSSSDVPSLKGQIVLASEGKRINSAARRRLFKKDRSL